METKIFFTILITWRQKLYLKKLLAIEKVKQTIIGKNAFTEGVKIDSKKWVSGSFTKFLVNNWHLLTETEGNSMFCGPETVDVSRGEAEGNIDSVKREEKYHKSIKHL